VEVVKVTPRGYCYGVVDAIQLARNAAQDPTLPRPIYILGLIVHNRHVVDMLSSEYGIISLDGSDRLALLNSIPSGTVIFTAHGVSPEVKRLAQARGLTCIDATCPDVTRTHELVQRLVAQNYHIIYVGKPGHPESEGVIGVAPHRVHLVENRQDVDALELPPGPLAITTQTTLSQWDTAELMAYIKQRYPESEVHNEICLATQQRQEAVVKAAREVDVVVVVGDQRSNNSNRLVQVVRNRANKPAYLVDSARDLHPAWFAGARKVAVTAGSSTPTHLTREVVEWLETYQPETGC
jgi:4-hydroxy-3-methylbut-2-enyl diphosphate reductase